MQDYGLLKIPDEVIITKKDKEIKELKTKIGTLESYISELEYEKKKYEKEHTIEFKESELYKVMRNQINDLESKAKKLQLENEKLFCAFVQIKKF